jgi:hypothetical protein
MNWVCAEAVNIQPKQAIKSNCFILKTAGWFAIFTKIIDQGKKEIALDGLVGGFRNEVAARTSINTPVLVKQVIHI